MYFLAFVGCGWFLCCLEMPFEISFRGRCVVQRFGAREGMDVKHIAGGVHEGNARRATERAQKLERGQVSGASKMARML